jgi:hypothetical protein
LSIKSINIIALVGSNLSQQLSLVATLGCGGSFYFVALAANSLDNVL